MLSSDVGPVQIDLVGVHRAISVEDRCAYRKLDPDVLVVETTENRPRKNPADGMNYT